MKNLNAMIRQTKQQIIDNLYDNFHPINLEIVDIQALIKNFIINLIYLIK